MNNLLKKVLLGMRKIPLLIESRFDRNFLASDVPRTSSAWSVLPSSTNTTVALRTMSAILVQGSTISL
jgi:hypothetical protein